MARRSTCCSAKRLRPIASGTPHGSSDQHPLHRSRRVSDDLSTLQRDFAASLRNANSELDVARWMVGDAASIERRMAIYRSNVQAAIGKALTAAYPVVWRILSVDFFDALTRAFLKLTPSTSGDLGDYGERFGPF